MTAEAKHSWEHPTYVQYDRCVNCDQRVKCNGYSGPAHDAPDQHSGVVASIAKPLQNKQRTVVEAHDAAAAQMDDAAFALHQTDCAVCEDFGRPPDPDSTKQEGE